MKPSNLLTGTATTLLLAGSASAFYGQMDASGYKTYGDWTWQIITLTDYYTGSVYRGQLDWGFNGCVGKPCQIQLFEQPNGEYNPTVNVWRTDDGCHNIDFLGALDAHHGYCCGPLPCDFTA